MELETTAEPQADNLTMLIGLAQHFLRFMQASKVIPKNFILKPVYNIAHMVNSIDRFEYVMDQGANGIGVDIEYWPTGVVSLARYGTAGCNCKMHECESSLNVSRLFNFIRESTRAVVGKYNRQLAIVVLCLKLEPVPQNTKEEAGINIAKLIINDLWMGVKYWEAMYVLVSVKIAEDRPVITGVQNTVDRLYPLMSTKIGFDARDEVNLTKLQELYMSLGVPGNYWQGDGISTCLRKDSPTKRLQTILDARDTDTKERYAEKVYQRTVDLREQMVRSLRRGVDAIVTNKPGRLTDVVKRLFPTTLRMATINDDPWVRFAGWAPFLRRPRDIKARLGDRFLDVIRGVND